MELVDLRSGLIYAGINSLNTWRTPLQAVLIEEEGCSYLAHNCRAENVHMAFPIFARRYSEVSALHSHDGDYLLRSGPAILSDQLALSDYSGGMKVEMGSQGVKYLTVQETLSELKSETIRERYFLQIEYVIDGRQYKLLSEAKYINFSSNTNEYMQPITGYILFRSEGKLFVGYVVSHMKSNGEQSTEFILRKKNQ